MKRRIFSMILTLCMLISMRGVPAVSEEALPLEEAVLEAQGETGAEGLFAGEADAPEETEEAPAQEEEPEEEETLPEGIPDEIALSPAFLQGYVRVTAEQAPLLDDAGARLTLLNSGDEAYAYDRTLEDRLALCYVGANGVVTGWMEAAALEALNADEETVLREALLSQDEVFWFDAQQTVPLPIIGREAAPVEEVEEPPVEETPIEEPPVEETPIDETNDEEDGAEDEISVTPPEVNKIPEPAPVLSAESLTLYAGTRAVISATAPEGVELPVTFVSDNPAVAEVDENGAVLGIAAGETSIRALCGGEAVCAVTVLAAPESLAFTQASVIIGKGEKIALGAILTGEAEYTGARAYATSNKKIVTVDAAGNVKGVKAGTATITVKAYNGVAAACKVTVKAAPTKITATPTKITLGVGETGRLGYTLPKNTAGRATYAVDKRQIATVDAQTGEVTAVAEGTAKVTIRSFNGKKATATVTVKRAPAEVFFSAEALVAGVGQKLVPAVGVDAGASSAFTCESRDESIATYINGAMVGVSEGETTIEVKTYNGLTATCPVKVVAPPTAVTLPMKSLTLGVGEKTRLEPDAGEGLTGFAFSTSKKAYVTIDAAGNVKGVKKGSATLTVKTYNGKTAKVSVTVKKAPSKVTLSPTKLTLGVGETGRFTVKLPSGTAGAVAWASADPEIAQIDPATGVITALAEGDVKITARSYNGKTASAVVSVKAAPESVHFNLESLTIGVGQKVTLSASVNDGAAGQLTYTSADNVLAVCAGAVVAGVAPGETRLIATAYNGVFGEMPLIVKPAPVKVTVPGTIYVGVGETVVLTPDVGDSVGGFTYSTNAKKIATVSAAGAVKGVKAGTATVTVKTYNGKSAKVKVVVRKAPGKVTISPTSKELGVGERFKPATAIPSGTAGGVKFSSTDESVLSVNPTTGEAEALSVGVAQLVAQTYNGKRTVCAVTVYPAPEWIETDVSFLEMGAGQTHRVAAQITPGSRSAIQWQSDDAAVARVAADGTITAVSRGSTVVRASTCAPGVAAEVTVTVWDAPTSVTLDSAELSMNVEETWQLEPHIPEGSMTAYTYTSSNAKVASVSADGAISAINRGTVTITVATHNGKKATLKLTVIDPWYPEAIALGAVPADLMEGETWQVSYRLTPENARPALVWKSSSPSVATVDDQGLVHALSYGHTTISAVSSKNSAVKLSFTLWVENERLTLRLPKWTTDVAGISDNLKMIDSVRASAISEVNLLYDNGAISAADAAKRRSMINNVFKDLSFPWMTPAKQKYWRAANSQGGLKDFQPGRVYFGMPYVSIGTNRQYNVDKALKENRYTNSGAGYYLLNQKNLLSGLYVGNDCSCLQDAAIWGTNSSHSADRTCDIAVSSSYKTVKDFKSMRPGDLICKSYSHVVMFLYYANAEKTEIMIIENGGRAKGTNTVHCDIYELSYYSGNGYKVRRLSTLG